MGIWHGATQPVFTCLNLAIENTRTRCEICSKFPIKTPERHQWCRSGVFIVNFEHISHLVLLFLLLTCNTCWVAEHVITDRVYTSLTSFSWNMTNKTSDFLCWFCVSWCFLQLVERGNVIFMLSLNENKNKTQEFEIKSTSQLADT